MRLLLCYLLLSSVFETGAWADEKVRPLHEQDLRSSPDPGVFVPGCKVAYINEPRLRIDFPELAHKSRPEIEKWILERYSYISLGQVKLLRLRNSQIPFDPSRQVTLYRPSNYGRAALLNGMDLKGIGLRVSAAGSEVDRLWEQMKLSMTRGQPFMAALLDKFRIRDHSDGLMSLGEAVAEATRQQAVQRLFDLRNAKLVDQNIPLETVETYFVLSYPFGIRKTGDKVIPAGLYARQLHYGRTHSGARAIPSDIYKDDHGGFQFTTRYSAVDFGGVIVTDPRLKDRFGTRPGGVASNPQDSLPWAYGHEAARAFAAGDSESVERHIREMLDPLDSEWRALDSTRRMNFLGRRHTRIDPKVILAWEGTAAANRREMMQWLNSTDYRKVELFSARLGALGGVESHEFFKLGLEHPSVVVQRYTASALAESRAPALSDFVLLAARSEDTSVRNYAYRAVKQLPSELRFAFLLHALSDVSQDSVRLAVSLIREVPAEQRAVLYKQLIAGSQVFLFDEIVRSIQGTDFPGISEVVKLGIERPGRWTDVFSDLKSVELKDWILTNPPFVKNNYSFIAPRVVRYSGPGQAELLDWLAAHPNFWAMLQNESVLERLESQDPVRAKELWNRWVASTADSNIRGQVLLRLSLEHFGDQQQLYLDGVDESERLRWLLRRLEDALPLKKSWRQELTKRFVREAPVGRNTNWLGMVLADPEWSTEFRAELATQPETDWTRLLSGVLKELLPSDCAVSAAQFFR